MRSLTVEGDGVEAVVGRPWWMVSEESVKDAGVLDGGFVYRVLRCFLGISWRTRHRVASMKM